MDKDIQAMRDHLATEVMGWHKQTVDKKDLSEQYWQTPLAKDICWYKGDEYQMTVSRWTPDKDANQLLIVMVMDTFHDMYIDKTVGKWCAVISNTPEIGDEWDSGYVESFCMAGCIAACKATGFEGEL